MEDKPPKKRNSQSVRVYTTLAGRIDSGEFKIGDYLPSERALFGEFGVSRPTVRKALQRLTREGYLSCHTGIGYEIVRIGQKSKDRTSRLIGVLWTPGDRTGYMDPRLPKIDEALAAHGYAMLLGFTGRELAAENQRVTAFAEQGVAGMIALPAQKGKGASRLGELIGEGFPVVAVGEPSRWCMSRSAAAACSYLGIDNSLGSQLALDRLHQLGHRRIAFARSGKNPLRTRRELGYRDWMAEMELSVSDDWMISCADGRRGGARGQLAALLDADSGGPTAILCETATEAVTVSAALEELGLSIPKDVSVAAFFGGIGNEPLVQGRKLAGLTYSWDDAITEIVATLTVQVRNRSIVRRTLLRPEFVEGETVAPAGEVKLRKSR